MKHYNRNLLVVIKDQFLDEQAIEQEMQTLNAMLALTETSRQFCLSHELVNRNHITNAPEKILKESRSRRLRSFRFLINKN